MHQQSACLAGDHRNGGEEAVGIMRLYEVCHPERNKCSRKPSLSEVEGNPCGLAPRWPPQGMSIANVSIFSPQPASLLFPALFRDVHNLVLKNKKVGSAF